MHNSTTEDGRQNHTMSLTMPRSEDVDNTDLEVTEIVEGTLNEQDDSGNKFPYPATNSQGTIGNLHETTIPSASTFRTMDSEDKWLKR